jgi:transcriptional antiterminator NusG
VSDESFEASARESAESAAEEESNAAASPQEGSAEESEGLGAETSAPDESQERPADAGAEESGGQEAAAETEEAEPEAAEAGEDPPAGPVEDDRYAWRWYAIHAYSGQEGHVKRQLEAKAEQLGIADRVSSILVPMEEVAEIKGGEKRISKRKFFPGYVLIRLPEHPERDADLWHMIKNTPGVSGFIGSRTAPVPLDESEVNAILEEMRGERERPKPKVQFEEGERVKIIDGPFANFLGNVSEINAERGTLKVSVEIFERQTSVEVEFWQVEKM